MTTKGYIGSRDRRPQTDGEADLPYDNSLSWGRISKSFLPGDMWLQGNPMLHDGIIALAPMSPVADANGM
jgi:hypothetical protein